MPRSLSQAGIGSAPVWIKAEHCEGQPFYVADAKTRTNQFGNEEVVFKLRLRDGVYDSNGETLHKIVHLSLTNVGGSRQDMVDYFRTSNDPLGPLVINRVPSKNGNDFFQMVDAQPFDLANRLEELPQLAPRTERQDVREEDLEDLPF